MSEYPTWEFRMVYPSGATECIELDGVGGFTQAAEIMRDTACDVLGSAHAVAYAYDGLCKAMAPIPLTDRELAECGGFSTLCALPPESER